MRGEQPHAVVADGPLGQRVADDLLPGQAVREQGRRARRHGIGEVRGLVEQGEHGVQVPVRGRAGRAPGRRGLLPARREPGGVPDGPQHVLGAAAGPDRRLGHRQQPGDVPGRARHAVRQRGQVPRVEQGRGQQVAAPARVAGRLGQQAEGPAQPAQAEGVGAAERAAQQLGRGLVIEHGGLQGAAQQQEQRPGPRLVGQRQLVTGHRDRDAGRGQRAAQQRHLPRRGPDQDRHGGPGHSAGQMSAAQRVGGQGRFGGGAVRDQDADFARLGVPGDQVPVADRAAGQPPGHPA